MHTKLNIHKHKQIMEDLEVGRDVKKRFCCRKISNLKVFYMAIIVTAPPQSNLCALKGNKSWLTCVLKGKKSWLT